MFGVSGRTMIVFVLCLGLIGVLLLGLAHAGFGWGSSSAARQALQVSLQGLARQPAPTGFDPPVRGRDATGAEAASLDQAVAGFLEAIRGKNVDAAWEMVDPASAGQLDKAQWAEFMTAAPESRGRMEETMGLLMGQKSRVAEVKTTGKSGVARVVVSLEAPLWLALVRKGDGWAIDLQRSGDLQAFHDVGKQLSVLQRDDAGSFFKAIIGMEGGSDWNDYLSLLALAPQGAKHEIVSRKVDDDHAVVQLQGRADLDLMVEMERQAQGWVPRWDSGLSIMTPGQTLAAEEGAPRRGGPAVQTCTSNVKQLMLGMLMYCQDYDERWPMANKWSDEIMPYIKNEQVFYCPAVPNRYGYALNYKLSKVSMAQMWAPAETVGLFDSTLLRPNAYDVGKQPGASVTWPPRHDGLIVYGYTDGHVKASSSPLPYPYWYQVGQKSPGPGAPGAPGPPPGGPPAPPG